MKKSLPLALALLILSAVPVMAADLPVDVKTGASTEQQTTRHEGHFAAEAQTGQGDQAGLKTSSEIQSESQSEAVAPSTEPSTAESPEASAMTGAMKNTESATEAPLEKDTPSSAKNVQKLFSKFQKENAPQTEARAKSDTQLETTTTNQNLK